MNKKAITNLLKLAMVVACVRESLAFLDSAVSPTYVVQEDDVDTAWVMILDSAHCFKTFKARFSFPLSDVCN